jgi:hypothetical protein
MESDETHLVAFAVMPTKVGIQTTIRARDDASRLNHGLRRDDVVFDWGYAKRSRNRQNKKRKPDLATRLSCFPLCQRVAPR